jgi:hypothetical protein
MSVSNLIQPCVRGSFDLAILALTFTLNVKGISDRVGLDLTQKGPLVGLQFSF